MNKCTSSLCIHTYTYMYIQWVLILYFACAFIGILSPPGPFLTPSPSPSISASPRLQPSPSLSPFPQDVVLVAGGNAINANSNPQDHVSLITFTCFYGLSLWKPLIIWSLTGAQGGDAWQATIHTSVHKWQSQCRHRCLSTESITVTGRCHDGHWRDSWRSHSRRRCQWPQ